MMNGVALFLVLSSLVTAGVWSPSWGGEKPVTGGGGEDVIVKEGHRVVVVEYDPETGGNTKVLISPQETHVSHQAKEKLSSFTDDAKGKAKETVEDAKSKAKETIDEAKEKGKEATSGRGPVEIVCDAYGICKQKVANVMGKEKEKASEATEKVHEVEEQAEEKVSEALGKTKVHLSHKAEKIKDTVANKAQQVGGGMKEAVDTSKTIGNNMAKNIMTEIDDAKEKAEKIKEKGERDLEDILTRGRDLVKDLFGYLVSPRLVGSTMGVVHLLGFATAYGMCIWVTFVSSYVLAGALPRQQFGMVQSKVYPVYFRVLAYTVMVTLIGHLYGMRMGLLENRVGMAQACSLLGSFGMVLFNLLYLEPRATKVMFERMKMEKEEARGRGHDGFISKETTKHADDHVTATSTLPVKAAGTQEKIEATDAATMAQMSMLGERLKKLNAYSSSLNILTLMALTGHIVYLGQRLHVTC